MRVLSRLCRQCTLQNSPGLFQFGSTETHGFYSTLGGYGVHYIFDLQNGLRSSEVIDFLLPVASDLVMHYIYYHQDYLLTNIHGYRDLRSQWC